MNAVGSRGPAGVHHQRQRGVDLVADRLAEAARRRCAAAAASAETITSCVIAADLQRHVQADDAERVDDDRFLDERLEAIQRDGDAVLARWQRRDDVDAGAGRLPHRVDAGRDVRGRHRRARQRGARGVQDACPGSSRCRLPEPERTQARAPPPTPTATRTPTPRSTVSGASWVTCKGLSFKPSAHLLARERGGNHEARSSSAP